MKRVISCGIGIVFVFGTMFGRLGLGRACGASGSTFRATIKLIRGLSYALLNCLLSTLCGLLAFGTILLLGR